MVRAAVFWMALGACPLAAQDGNGRGALMAKGISAGAMQPREAAEAFAAVLALDSLDAEAHWRLAIALADLGKRTPDDRKDPVRDSLYRAAEQHARRAVELAPDDADARFALAFAVGKAALTKGRRERVKYAIEIREQALRALELNPRQDGALHVLGRWHAEIERLSNIEEFFAKRFLGAKVFGEASWEQASASLERAIEIRPDYVYHRLGYAEILVDMKRFADARAQLDAIPGLPDTDAMDPEWRRQAEALRARIARR